MAQLHKLGAALLLIFATFSSAWTHTQYVQIQSIFNAYSETKFVSPTGPVSPTSTKVTTTSLYGNLYSAGTWVVTLTELYIPTDAPVCSWEGGCPSPSTPVSTSISTRFYAPLIIQNPSSCTKTSFSYTSSAQVYPTLDLNGTTIDLSPQATKSVEAVFVTTYFVTLSTDLGGQAVTTGLCDVYLKQDTVLGIVPDSYYLDECVDPSHYRCLDRRTSCVSDVPITYPTGSPTASGNGAVAGTVNPWLMLSVAALAILCVA